MGNEIIVKKIFFSYILSRFFNAIATARQNRKTREQREKKQEQREKKQEREKALVVDSKVQLVDQIYEKNLKIRQQNQREDQLRERLLTLPLDELKEINKAVDKFLREEEKQELIEMLIRDAKGQELPRRFETPLHIDLPVAQELIKRRLKDEQRITDLKKRIEKVRNSKKLDPNYQRGQNEHVNDGRLSWIKSAWSNLSEEEKANSETQLSFQRDLEKIGLDFDLGFLEPASGSEAQNQTVPQSESELGTTSDSEGEYVTLQRLEQELIRLEQRFHDYHHLFDDSEEYTQLLKAFQASVQAREQVGEQAVPPQQIVPEIQAVPPQQIVPEIQAVPPQQIQAVPPQQVDGLANLPRAGWGWHFAFILVGASVIIMKGGIKLSKNDNKTSKFRIKNPK